MVLPKIDPTDPRIRKRNESFYNKVVQVLLDAFNAAFCKTVFSHCFFKKKKRKKKEFRYQE